MAQFGSPEEWFRALPPVTKSLLLGYLGTTCLLSFGILSPGAIYLDLSLVWSKFQIWRLITNLLFLGPFSFGFVFQLFIFVQYSPRYEESPFPTGGSPAADFAFMLLIGAAVLTVIGYMMSLPFLSPALLFMIIYAWSRRNPQQRVSFFGFQFPAMYLPWVMTAFSVLMGGSPLMDLIGIATGHVYYFLVEVYPQTQGQCLVRTPVFMEGLVGLGHGPQRARPGSQPAAQTMRGHSWGAGRPLGAS